MMTPLGERLRLFLDEEFARMQNEWFFKWHFIGRDGPVEIDSFRGRPICYGGIKFEGSPVQVYWDTIQLYLRKKIAEVFDKLEADLRGYPIDVRIAALQEGGQLIKAFAARIRNAAIEKDRILRGNGFEFPNRRDVGLWAGSLSEDIDGRIFTLRDIYCDPQILVDGVEMPFRSMLKDKVTFAKKDGTIVLADIAASVQPGQIFVFDATLPIEVDDHFLRQLPSGLVEDYIVIDPRFMAGGSGIPAHFQTKVRRSDQPAGQPQTVINNIIGHNARININSVDSSNNSVVENSPAVFAELRKALVAVEDVSKRELLASLISEMAEANARKDGSFKERYQRFVSIAADCMTIFAPFLPALSGLL